MRNLLLLGTAVLLASCGSSQLPPAGQRRVNKDASLRDFAGSYRNGPADEGPVTLWSCLQTGAAGGWSSEGWRHPDEGSATPPSHKILFLRENQPDSRIMLSIEPNGDLRFRNRLKNGTEVGRGRIRAKDYRFEDGWIVILEETEGHAPGPYYPGVAVTHKRFALGLNADRSLMVEQKSRFTGTTFIILPLVSSEHKVTVYPRTD